MGFARQLTVAFCISCLAVVGWVFLLGISKARAEYVIGDNRGGMIGRYEQAFATIAQSGQRVRVVGGCLSACTVVLKLPPSRICVQKGAQFGFHASWAYDNHNRPVQSREGTARLWTWYPSKIRAWINAHGGLTPKMIYLKGSELYAMYPVCKTLTVKGTWQSAFNDIQGATPPNPFYPWPMRLGY